MALHSFSEPEASFKVEVCLEIKAETLAEKSSATIKKLF